MEFDAFFPGEEREVRRFIWFPAKINGTIYWLKTVTIHQSYGTSNPFGWCNDWVVDTEEAANNKIKVYKVYPKNNHDLWYLVDAPNKYIAKWCGTGILNNTYAVNLTAKDMVAERWEYEE